MTAVNEETAIVIHQTDVLGVVHRVLAETDAQVEKWGIQRHPDGTGGDRVLRLPRHQAPRHGVLADHFRDITDQAALDKNLTWRDIALEEMFEALAESDPEYLVKELIQTAAVLVSWAVDVESRP